MLCLLNNLMSILCLIFFFQAEDGIRDLTVTGVQTCALPIFVGDPDIYGSYSGRMFQFEVKIGKEQPTAIQKRRMKEWIRVGAHVAVVRSVKEAVEELSWV